MKRKRINPYKLFVGSFIPNWLIVRSEISPGAKLLYARLSQYAGKKGYAFPGQETIAKELGVSKRSITSYLTELIEHELIEKERRGLKKTNRYYFLQHSWMEEPFPSRDANIAHQEWQDPANQDGKDPATPIGKESEEKNKKENKNPSLKLPSLSQREEVLESVSKEESSYKEIRNEAIEWLKSYREGKTVKKFNECIRLLEDIQKRCEISQETLDKVMTLKSVLKKQHSIRVANRAVRTLLSALVAESYATTNIQRMMEES